MSLVGTRPPTLDEWNQYKPHHRARMSFRPGLTGLWQVSGRSNITDFMKKILKRLCTGFLALATVVNVTRESILQYFINRHPIDTGAFHSYMMAVFRNDPIP